MKPQIVIILILALLLKAEAVSANTLNEAVKEARKQGQVLSAKTREGVHEIRVVTPRGSVKTIRKPAIDNRSTQRQPEPNNRLKYEQQRPESSRIQRQRSDNRRKNPYSRQPEFRRFNRPAQSNPSSRNQTPVRQPTPQPRRQPSPRRSKDRDPD